MNDSGDVFAPGFSFHPDSIEHFFWDSEWHRSWATHQDTWRIMILLIHHASYLCLQTLQPVAKAFVYDHILPILGLAIAVAQAYLMRCEQCTYLRWRWRIQMFLRSAHLYLFIATIDLCRHSLPALSSSPQAATLPSPPPSPSLPSSPSPAPLASTHPLQLPSLPILSLPIPSLPILSLPIPSLLLASLSLPPFLHGIAIPLSFKSQLALHSAQLLLLLFYHSPTALSTASRPHPLPHNPSSQPPPTQPPPWQAATNGPGSVIASVAASAAAFVNAPAAIIAPAFLNAPAAINASAFLNGPAAINVPSPSIAPPAATIPPALNHPALALVLLFQLTLSFLLPVCLSFHQGRYTELACLAHLTRSRRRHQLPPPNRTRIFSSSASTGNNGFPSDPADQGAQDTWSNAVDQDFGSDEECDAWVVVEDHGVAADGFVDDDGSGSEGTEHTAQHAHVDVAGPSQPVLQAQGPHTPGPHSQGAHAQGAHPQGAESALSSEPEAEPPTAVSPGLARALSLLHHDRGGYQRVPGSTLYPTGVRWGSQRTMGHDLGLGVQRVVGQWQVGSLDLEWKDFRLSSSLEPKSLDVDWQPPQQMYVAAAGPGGGGSGGGATGVCAAGAAQNPGNPGNSQQHLGISGHQGEGAELSSGANGCGPTDGTSGPYSPSGSHLGTCEVQAHGGSAGVAAGREDGHAAESSFAQGQAKGESMSGEATGACGVWVGGRLCLVPFGSLLEEGLWRCVCRVALNAALVLLLVGVAWVQAESLPDVVLAVNSTLLG